MSVKAPLVKAIQYALTRWVALTRYVDNGALEIDNNAAERAMRMLVLGRGAFRACMSTATTT